MKEREVSLRFDYLAVGSDGDVEIIRFDPRLTVVSGLDRHERSEMFDLLSGALAGTSPQVAEAGLVCGSGRFVRMSRNGGAAVFDGDHGDAQPSPLTTLGLDADALRPLMLVRGSDVGVTRAPADEAQAELEEARSMLVALSDSLTEALAMRSRVDILRDEVTALDHALEQAEGVRGPGQGAIGSSTAPSGTRHPTIGGPEAVTTDWEAAEACRATLEKRLAALTATKAPKPPDPGIGRLAHGDQELTWAAARRAVGAARRLEVESTACGGLGSQGVTSPVADRLEVAHEAVDRAEHLAGRRRFAGVAAMLVGLVVTLVGALITPAGLVVGAVIVLGAAWWAIASPRRACRRARALEQSVLDMTGVPSYIGFQLRRVEAAVNPSATEALEAAAISHSEALEAWHELAGADLDPFEALRHEHEVRSYAASLIGLRGTAAEVAEARRELMDEVQPAPAQAREALLAARAPAVMGAPEPRSRGGSGPSGEERDVEELRRRRQQAQDACADAERSLPDLWDLSDRLDGMQRRVAMLADRRSGGDDASAGPTDLEELLLARRVASARRAGAEGESVPLVLDEPFENVHGVRKWVILDAVERLAASVQITYLTEDVDTVEWARRRSEAGTVSLLEPLTQPVADQGGPVGA